MKTIFLLSIASFVLGCAEIPQTNIDQPEVNAPQSGSLSETEQITNFTHYEYPTRGVADFSHCLQNLQEEEEKRNSWRTGIQGAELCITLSCMRRKREQAQEQAQAQALRTLTQLPCPFL